MSLLILDLDETLWHATYENLPQAADCVYKGRNVYFRPNAKQFIKEIAQISKLAIWTSAKAHYAKYCLKKLTGDLRQFAFIRTRKDCKKEVQWNQFSNETIYIKNIADLDDAYIIDDRFDCVIPNERCIRIQPFYGDREDSALTEILISVQQIVNK